MLNLLSEHLDIWTGAPVTKANTGRGRSAAKQSTYGIKKLRELILELAVRGMLVDQDPHDEPASVLLEKIAKEKGRLIKEGKIKKQPPLPEISEEERPFDLPKGWRFVRLGELTNRIGSGSTPRGGKSAYEETGIPFLRSQNIWNHGLELEEVVYISDDTHQKMSNTVVEPNDILLNITGASLGRCTVYPEGAGEANVSQHVSIIRPTDSDTRFYLHLCVLSPYTQSLVWGRQVGMAREGLSKKILELFELPLPPLAEQHRIVAKVDELMALCDRLEQQQGDSSATHQTLVETLLATLITAPDHQNFAESWQRIATHFDTLFTTEESIDQLKQTILQLAVLGKLLSQDPNDEPASVLLEKISKEKARLVKEGKIKKQKPLPEISGDEIPHAIPINWSWAYFQDVTALITDGEHATPPRVSLAGIPMATAKNIRDGFVDLRDTDFVSEETACKCWKRCRPEHDDILMVCVGATTGRLTVIKEPEEFIMVRSVALIRPFSPHVLPEYLALSLRSPIGQKQIWGNVRQSAQPCLYIGKMNELQIPIPPLAEQRRIVAKVDELMALCDQLKAKLIHSQEQRETLIDAMFQQLLVV